MTDKVRMNAAIANHYTAYINTVAAMAPIAHSLHVGPVHWPRRTAMNIYLRPPEMVFVTPHPKGKFVYRRTELLDQLNGLRAIQESLVNDGERLPSLHGDLARLETKRFGELIAASYDAAVGLHDVTEAKRRRHAKVRASEQDVREAFAPMTRFIDQHTGLALLALASDDPIGLYFDRETTALRSVLMMG